MLARRARIDRILRWLRACAICGSWWPPIDFLCEECWRELHLHQQREACADYPFPVRALWLWTPKNDHQLRSLIHGFKRGFAVAAARDFARALAADLEGERVYLVHPPATDGGFDHAQLLAEALRECFPGSPCLRLTKRPGDQGRQKLKNATDRALFRFQRVENFSAEGRLVVFVDDLVTTGSTAMAAYMALGDPERFEAWALAIRPKVARKRSF